jgi:hypothetical protein
MVVGTAVNLVMVVVTTGTIATAAAIVNADGVMIVTVILMAVTAVIVTVIGAGALLVVTRPIIAGAKVSPGALPGAVAQLVRQGTMMAPTMTAPAGKFAFHYLSTWRFVGIFAFRRT